MRLKMIFAAILFVGCDQGAPPFDELPLRDALRAEPEVVAALPEDARIRLAARLETVRANDTAIDEVDARQAAGPATLVAALDRVRQRRQGEPLMVGVLGNGAAWPIRDRAAMPSHAPALPQFEGPLATATATMETRALETEAGAAVRGLFAASGAHHLVRVVGWPVGAVAIDDTVYLNAAWLVSLAPSGDQKIDGGAWDGSVGPGSTAAGGTAAGSTAAGGTASANSGGVAQDPSGAAPAAGIDTPARILGALTSANQGDAGTAPQPSSPQAPPVVDAGDACSACASGCDTSGGDSCATASDDGGDSCDASAADDGSNTDSCNTASSDGSDACSAGSDSGAEAASCQISRGHGRKSLGTRLWLLAPLAFLLLRRRS